ncbi:MAG: DUF748 domain-containing protein [Candidatus Omnitrophica bacterium]|nr:DUF748 domain-containing protein [Candidatus Omnitrophota bacterium]
MKYKITYLWILISIAIGLLGFFYIQNVLIPVKLKTFLAKRIEDTLRRPVNIGGLTFRLIDGLVVKDLIIYNDPSQKTYLFKAHEISFNVLFLPFIKGKTIIVPSITIKDPDILVIKNKNNNINISDLLNLQNKKRGNGFSFFIRKIHLNNGSLTWQDQSQDPMFTEKIDKIDLQSSIGLDKKIHFLSNAFIPKKNSIVNINGSYDLKNKLWFSWVHVENLHLAQYLQLLSNPYDIKFNEGNVESADVEMTYQKNALLIKGNASLKNADIHFTNNRNLSGNIHLDKFTLGIGKEVLKLNGALTFDQFYVILDDKNDITLSGRISVNSGEIKKNNIALKGDLDLKTLSCRIQGTQFLQTDLMSKSYTVTTMPQGVVLTGDIVSNNTFLKLSTDKTIQTTLKANYATFNIKNNETELNTDLTALLSDLFVKDQFRAKGELTTKNFHLLISENGIDIDAPITTKDFNAAFKNGLIFSGNPALALKTNKLNETLSYNGTIELNDGQLSHIPYVENISNLNGTLNFTSDAISSDAIKLKFLNTDAIIKGGLDFSAEPKIDITFNTQDIDLGNLTNIPSIQKLIEPLVKRINGHSAVQISYNGALDAFNVHQLNAKLVLNNVDILSPHIPAPLTNINGRLSLSQDLLTWETLEGTYANNQWTLDGKIEKFSRPTMYLSVRSKDLRFDTEIKILRRAFQFVKFDGKFMHSNLSMEGDVHLPENSMPDVDVRLNFKLNLNDLKKLLEDNDKNFQFPELVGSISGDGLYRGKFNDWRNWQLVLNLSAAQILAYNHPIENILVRYEQRGRYINVFDLSGEIYDGKLTVSGSADLNKDDLPAKMKIDVLNLDLETLNQTRKTKFQYLAGKFNGAVELTELPLSHPMDAKGSGFFKISDGLLGQFIPQIDESYFTSANGDFKVGNQGLSTENTSFYGERISINAKGKIGFDQNINIMLYPEYHQILDNITSLSGSPGPTKTFNHILNIKTSGTLSHPQYTPTVSPVKAIQGAAEAVKSGIGTILEEIF